MKIKNINKLTCSLLFISLVMLGSCKKSVNDFLNVLPSKSSNVPISTIANLDALLDDQRTMGLELGGKRRVLGTDDIGLTPQLVTDCPPFYNTLETFYFGTWDRKYSENLKDPYGQEDWSFQWGRIFTANLILSSLPKVSGSDDDKARLSNEAHFVRAFAYWVLVNTYCLPYTAANQNEAGLPLKLNPNFEEDLTRVPLHRIYELIDADLKEALKVTDPLLKNGRLRPWRANVAGVNAFAARYNLFLGNYAEAERYASLSLNAYSTLVNYSDPAQMGYYAGLPNWPSTAGIADDVLWKEFTSYRSSSVDQLIVPSADLKSLFDQTNDLRYVYYVVELGGAVYGLPAVTENYSQLGFADFVSGTTVGETMVTKAEALARLNRVGEAMTVVNQLRVSRFKSTASSSIINLTATTQADAVKKILEERRRELPFTMRWYDLRRLNHNDDPNDDKTLTRQFYQVTANGINTSLPTITYTLAPGSRNWALMIPKSDIVASQNVITQNTY